MTEQPKELEFSELKIGKYYKVRKYKDKDTDKYEYEFFLGKAIDVSFSNFEFEDQFPVMERYEVLANTHAVGKNSKYIQLPDVDIKPKRDFLKSFSSTIGITRKDKIETIDDLIKYFRQNNLDSDDNKKFYKKFGVHYSNGNKFGIVKFRWRDIGNIQYIGDYNHNYANKHRGLDYNEIKLGYDTTNNTFTAFYVNENGRIDSKIFIVYLEPANMGGKRTRKTTRSSKKSKKTRNNRKR